ncbi:MAG: DUF1015 domain-containing protein [Gammaproteobacteria bacterium]|nr:MAG: DUF1015 domain-containing protein [Gammaproteobacteria bacterium]
MSLVRPFAAVRPAPDSVSDTVAPPYDVVNRAEAKKLAQGNPRSFLRISRPEIEFDDSVSPYSDEVYQRGVDNFRNMINQGVLVQDTQPAYYVYRQHMGDHQQTGFVGVASCEAYDDGRIKKHEFTRPDKEDDRARQIDMLNAQPSPVFLTYKHTDGLDRVLQKVSASPPDVDVTTEFTGVRHQLWVVDDPETLAGISGEFERLNTLYVADGHHRTAAASRVAARRKAANPGHTGEENYNYCLAVMFPDNQVQILDYNRVVKDLNGLNESGFLDAVKEAGFTVEPSAAPVKPAKPGEVGMYLNGRWYRLGARPEWITSGDPVNSLDISVLADHLLSPVLDVHDPRTDTRIDFVGGIRGLEGLEQRVDSGEMAVAFSLFPTSLDQLMAVADSGNVMPPKSTWFEPKLADGLVSFLLE